MVTVKHVVSSMLLCALSSSVWAWEPPPGSQGINALQSVYVCQTVDIYSPLPKQTAFTVVSKAYTDEPYIGQTLVLNVPSKFTGTQCTRLGFTYSAMGINYSNKSAFSLNVVSKQGTTLKTYAVRVSIKPDEVSGKYLFTIPSTNSNFSLCPAAGSCGSQILTQSYKSPLYIVLSNNAE